MPDLPKPDWLVLHEYVFVVLDRLSTRRCTPADAHEDLMSPLTKWAGGDRQEFVRYMRAKLAEWKGQDGKET
jgi:hypothetical protein